MLEYPNINPTIVKLGMFEIRWYGLLYIVGFVIAFIFFKKFLSYRDAKLDKESYEDLLFNLMLGVILGGRLGYIIFYNLPYYFSHPLQVFAVWEGGMSFHGGVLGVIIFGYFFAKKKKISFFQFADPMMPLAAIGIGIGRVGNFINAELYGRITSKPWGMIFPNSDGMPRHASQLYEAFLEGLVLFLITYYILKKTKAHGVVFWSWISGYGLFRFLVEFVREPDQHLGLGFLSLSRGQMLSLPMFLVGIIAIIYLYKKENHAQKSINNS